jgi:hypothetical protein
MYGLDLSSIGQANFDQELENLAENGAISDAAYDTIMQSLPAESPLNGLAPSRGAAASPSPVPAASFSNLSVNDPPPPAYNTPTPPSLPGRTPSKPEISRATALYRYTETGDCNFEVGDQITVYEHMNADWWLGKNLRTGQEGVFPVNYVQVQTNPDRSGGLNGNMSPGPQGGSYGNEKANGYGGYQPQQQYQGPPPPGPSNPYDSAVPPMQIAEQPTESKPGKGQEMGKKFGKKLGNAAIFGAGATMGGNLVNSIF